MNQFEQRVSRQMARLEMEPETRLGVAVSGGADSVCLLRALHELRYRLTVVHVNHLLRGAESEADQRFVEELASELGIECCVERVDVAAVGGNLEEEARRARYEYFEKLIDDGVVDRVATGHTLTDQAETVLFRILRGTHLRGLTGIHASNPVVIRPLIEVTRAEVEEYLRLGGFAWRTDSSNQDRRFARNRIRHELMPQLRSEWNPEIERVLAHQASIAADEEAYWRVRIDELARAVFEVRGNNIIANASKLLEQPVAAVRRLVRRAIAQVKGDLNGIGFQHVEAILDLARGGEGHGRLQAPGIDVMRSFDWLRFAQLFAPGEGPDRLLARNYEVSAQVGGMAVLPGNSGWIKLEVIENTGSCAAPEGSLESARVKEAMLDLDRVMAIGAELRLRTWKPGDQYSRQAGSVPVKVKQMFQDERVPLWDRADWPMITAGQRIIWVKQFGPAAEVIADNQTRRLLRVRENYL